MDEDRIAGAAQKLGGTAKETAGRALGDTNLHAEGKVDKATGTARNVVGGAKDAARDWGDDVQGELGHLRGEVERLMRERVAPALAGAAETAEDYARQAKDVVVQGSERVSIAVKDRPLLALGLAVGVAYLIGRLAGGSSYVYPRR